MINLKDICIGIEKAALETSKFILRESEVFDINRTEKKGHNDFVSYVDKGSEKMLVEKLGSLLPEAGFNTEEGTSVKKGSKYCWVVDPLDGTTNFLHGFHPYAISIGLMEYDDVVAGVVLEVSGNEIFSAWKDGGAWLNGKKIHMSKVNSLADSLLATGFPYNNFEILSHYMDCLAYLVQNTQGIRRLGSAAIDMAYVACGRFDGFYEYDLHPWDVAAGTVLVREAGGRVSDFSGNEKNISGKELIASNLAVYPELQEILYKFMNAKQKS
jgi:myo-inositol-1(or 4)-monophosphatase